MTPTSTDSTGIILCLQEEITAMNSLATLLKNEQSALVDGDIPALNQHILNKGTLVSQIVELEKKRNSCLLALGCTSDAEGMSNYLQQLAEASEVKQLWTQLLSISEQAKENNRTNGMLINRRLSINQAALGALQQSNQAPSLYGPTGHSTIKSSPNKGVVVR